MKIHEYAEFLTRAENTTKRLEITEILISLLSGIKPQETQEAVNLMLGTLGPSFNAPVFNIAEQMNLAAISFASNVPVEQVKTEYKHLGDMGQVAEKLVRLDSKELSVKEVYSMLFEIAEFEGEGSVERKIEALAELYKQLDKNALRFIARIPVSKLRLGFSEKTILDALSKLYEIDKKTLSSAFDVMPDIALLSEKLAREGKDAIEKITPVFGIPVLPMLAARLKSPDEMIKKMGEVSIEPKFDGLRALIHYDSKHGARCFSRNLNDVTESFPEVQDIAKYTHHTTLILDAEAIGVDTKRGMFLDFQKTMSRRSKHGVDARSKEIPLTFQIFDVLLVDNTSYLNTPYIKRRQILEKIFKKNTIFFIDEHTVTTDSDVIRTKHTEYRKKGLEGVIVKKTDSLYVSGRTGYRWVKMKESEDSHAMLSDTVDAVIMGYTQGKGKRAQFGIGQFLAGIIHGEKIVSITKVGTGLSDAQFIELEMILKELKIMKKPKEYEVHKDLEPDYWVEPKIVVELAADEITASPKHTSGFALRFPRLIQIRSDKGAKDATTLQELKNI